MIDSTNSPDHKSQSSADDSAQFNGIDIHPHAVARNTALLLGFHIFTKLLAFISFILLANYLGTEIFGAYNYAFALTALFIPLCDLGMDTYLMREVPKLRKEMIPAQLGAALSWKGLLTFLVFLCISLLGSILDSFGSEKFYLVVLAGLVTLLRTFWTTFGSLLRSLNKVGYEVTLLSLTRIGEFIVILFCIETNTGLITMLAALAVINLFAVAITFGIIRLKLTRPVLVRDFETMLRMIKEGLPFALASIFTSIYFNFDTVLVAKFINDDAAGIYRAAFNLMLPLMMITASISGALFPFVSQNFYRDRSKVENVIRQSITYLVFLGLPIAFGTMILSGEIIQLFFDPEFSSASTPLAILIWFIPIAYLTNIFGSVLGAIGDQKFVLKIATLNVIFNVISNLFVIPAFAQIGASVTSVSTELLGFTFLLSRITRRIEHPFEFIRIGKSLIALLIMVAFLLYHPVENIPLLIFLAALIYIVVLFAVRAITLKELLKFKNLKQGPHESI